MNHRQKLKQLARILDHDDYASAHLWTDVAEILRQIAGDRHATRTAAR
jgi:hypothetical protein